MTSEKAPAQIWAQDAEPDACEYIGGGWWDDAIGSRQYPDTLKYIRSDLVAAKDARIAELEAALEELACRHVTSKPLWWQEIARAALKGKRQGFGPNEKEERE